MDDKGPFSSAYICVICGLIVPHTIRASMNRWIRIIAPMAGLLGVILLFAILTGSPERYLSGANLRVVLAQTVIVAIGATGMALIIVSGGIDPPHRRRSPRRRPLRGHGLR